MDAPTKLDRLSALLQGLAPRVTLAAPAPLGAEPGTATNTSSATRAWPAVAGPQLHLHVLDNQEVQLQAHGLTRTVCGPAFWLCRGDTAHAIHAASAQALGAVLSATVQFDGAAAPLLLAEFAQPRLVMLNASDTLLSQLIALVRSELQSPRCGQPALLNHAGDMLFIGVLRHLVAQPAAHGGLFNGLADPRIASTLVAMHEAPHLDWTLASLAQRAGMSRTAFAVRFKNTVQQPPGKYLSSLRLQIAQRKVQSGQGLKAAARAAGYANVSALSRALGKMPG